MEAPLAYRRTVAGRLRSRPPFNTTLGRRRIGDSRVVFGVHQLQGAAAKRVATIVEPLDMFADPLVDRPPSDARIVAAVRAAQNVDRRAIQEPVPAEMLGPHYDRGWEAFNSRAAEGAIASGFSKRVVLRGRFAAPQGEVLCASRRPDSVDCAAPAGWIPACAGMTRDRATREGIRAGRNQANFLTKRRNLCYTIGAGPIEPTPGRLNVERA
jgi:hypothetical protein